MGEVAVPTFGLWINGKSVPAQDGLTFERRNPYDNVLSGVFANASEADTKLAIAVAREAFDSGPWPRMKAHDRFKILSQTANLMNERENDFAYRMAVESGKPLATGLGELRGAARTFEFYAGAALDVEGSSIVGRVDDGFGIIIKEPVGVTGFLSSWNFPILNPTVKIAAALAVGCTVIVKPAQLCPGPMFLLAQCLDEAGLPAGVFNVVTSNSGSRTGGVITGSADVDRVAFTGSTQTGSVVMRTAADTNKPVTLELGGKSANIVFADADLDEAAKISVRAFCNNSGQQCSAGTRLLVESSVHEEFVKKLVAYAESTEVVGDPLAPETTMGPLVDDAQFKIVTDYIEMGKKLGNIVTGGTPTPEEAARRLVRPTIVDNVDNSSQIAQEEIFGPVLVVTPFETEADAIRLANDSEYGLAGGVWTSSLDKALRVVRGVRTGKMFVNGYNNVGIDDMPHGGYKRSGIGREQGRIGLEEYLAVKTVQIKIAPSR